MECFLVNVFRFWPIFFEILYKSLLACLSILQSACLVELYEKTNFLGICNWLYFCFRILSEMFWYHSQKIVPCWWKLHPSSPWDFFLVFLNKHFKVSEYGTFLKKFSVRLLKLLLRVQGNTLRKNPFFLFQNFLVCYLNNFRTFLKKIFGTFFLSWILRVQTNVSRSIVFFGEELLFVKLIQKTEQEFFGFSAKTFRHSCQNCILRNQRKFMVKFFWIFHTQKFGTLFETGFYLSRQFFGKTFEGKMNFSFA